MAANNEQPIRSITRALRVLQAINRHGSVTLTQISKEAEIPYPTTCRIIYTLIGEGIIEREPSRKYYRPTALAQSLSCGYQEQLKLVAVARKHIVELTKSTGWPVSIATRIGTVMVIQDSTHNLTAMTFSEYHPGYTMPIEASASGMAYLAFTEQKEREHIVSQIRHANQSADGNPTSNLRDNYFDMIVEDGYASFVRNPHTKNPGKTSSIAVPLSKNDDLVGVMTLIYFSTSMKVADAFKSYGKQIRLAQSAINEDLSKLRFSDDIIS